LKPSHLEFGGETGLTEKSFPVTGRLRSPQVGEGSLAGTKLTIQGAGGASELLTVIE
jgi:hypothetical protein